VTIAVPGSLGKSSLESAGKRLGQEEAIPNRHSLAPFGLFMDQRRPSQKARRATAGGERAGIPWAMSPPRACGCSAASSTRTQCTVVFQCQGYHAYRGMSKERTADHRRWAVNGGRADVGTRRMLAPHVPTGALAQHNMHCSEHLPAREGSLRANTLKRARGTIKA
jgi:hypothetical protein